MSRADKFFELVERHSRALHIASCVIAALGCYGALLRSDSVVVALFAAAFGWNLGAMAFGGLYTSARTNRDGWRELASDWRKLYFDALGQLIEARKALKENES